LDLQKIVVRDKCGETCDGQASEMRMKDQQRQIEREVIVVVRQDARRQIGLENRMTSPRGKCQSGVHTL
jgi:hypothetical protein